MTSGSDHASGSDACLEDRYVLGELLGAGSMGVVFAARDTGLDMDVAVKILRSELASSRRHVESFKSEAAVARRMQSRHAVQLLGLAVTADGIPCIIYERLEGETLGQRIARDGGVSLADTVEIVRQTSQALSRAHAMGVLHRDVKPDNIFLSRDVDGLLLVKLLDFGIAETADGAGSYAHCALAGTPEYMAPEVLLGTHDLDDGADLYALGVVVFECLTGACPIPGAFEDVIEQLRAGTRAQLTESRPDLHGAVDGWMQRALHPDPFWRFGSAKELCDELEAATRAPSARRAVRVTVRAAA
jgi:serine/threonine protein kinase